MYKSHYTLSNLNKNQQKNKAIQGKAEGKNKYPDISDTLKKMVAELDRTKKIREQL